tara:strand:+ start:12891 stop:13658 length:768 start_codon:yes stop_codon:yes gene_type:complete
MIHLINIFFRTLLNAFYKIFLFENRFKRFSSEEFSWINYSHSSPESKFPLEKQYAVDFAMRNLGSNSPILEIGACSGRSTSFLGCLIEKYNKKNILVVTDPWLNCPDETLIGPRKKSPSSYRAYIKEQYMNNMKFWFEEALPITFQLDSDSFFDEWKEGLTKKDLFNNEYKMGGEICFCYLDGDHSYNQVKKDFQNIDRILEKGGYIFFDDSDRLHRDRGETVNGCYEVVKEVIKTKRYVVALRNPNYLLKKISN